MRLPKRKTVIKYAIAVAVGMLFSWLNLAIQKAEFGSLLDRTLIDQLRVLCDTFTVPGLMLILSGLLVVVANEGSFTGVQYLGHYVYHMLVPGKRGGTKRYSDFIEEKTGNRVTGFGFLFHVGVLFLVVALVFYVLYRMNA